MRVVDEHSPANVADTAVADTAVADRPRPVWQYIFGAGVLLTIAFLAYQMILGPVHAVADATACMRAYADARTRPDTVSVDFMSYPDSGGRRRKMLCGMLRPMPVASLGR